MPSLLRAYEIGARAAAVGFDWARATDVLDKIDEEVLELRHEVESGATGQLSRAEEEMGDLLFAIANLSRKLGIEPEAALRRANDKFTRRFEAVEHAFSARGESLQGATLAANGRRVAACEARIITTKGTKDSKLTKAHQPRRPRRSRATMENIFGFLTF